MRQDKNFPLQLSPCVDVFDVVLYKSGKLTECSSLHRFLGFNQYVLLKDADFEELIAQEDVDKLRVFVKNTLDLKPQEAIYVRLVDSNSSLIWFELSVQTVVLGQKASLRMTVLQSLLRHEYYSHKLFYSTQHVYFWLSGEGLVLGRNQLLSNMFDSITYQIENQVLNYLKEHAAKTQVVHLSLHDVWSEVYDKNDTQMHSINKKEMCFHIVYCEKTDTYHLWSEYPKNEIQETGEDLLESIAEVGFITKQWSHIDIILENVSEVIWVYNADLTQILFVNSTYETVWNRKKEELYEYPFSYQSSIYPQDYELFQLHLDQYSTSGFFDLSYRIMVGDNQIRWVEARMKRIFGENGVCLGHVGSAKDITHLKSVESTLKDNIEQIKIKDQYLESILQTQDEMICRFKPDTSLTFANAAYLRKFNLTVDDFKGKRILDLISSSAQEKLLTYLKSFNAEKEVDTYIEEVETSDGSKEYHLWKDSTIKDVSGNIIEFQSIGQDITLLQSRQMMLEQAMLALKNSQKVAKVGSYVIDLESNYCHSSDILNEILGIPEKEIHAMEIWESLIHPSDKDFVLRKHSESLYNKLGYSIEYRILRHDNHEVRWISDICNYMWNDKKSTSQMIGTMMDITEQKTREITLMNQKTELDLLFSFANEANKQISLQVLITFVMNTLKKVLGSNNVIASLFFPGDEFFKVVYKSGEYFKVVGEYFSKESGITGAVLKTTKLTIIDDYVNDARTLKFEGSERLKQAIVLPLIFEESVFGVIIVAYNRDCTIDFDTKNLNLVSTLLEISASAIKKLLSIEDANRRYQRLEALLEINQIILNRDSVQSKIYQLLEVSKKQLLASAIALITIDDTYDCKVQNQDFKEYSSSIKNTFNYDNSEMHFDSQLGISSMIANFHLSSETNREDDNEVVVSYHAVPVFANQEVFGMIETYHIGLFYNDKEWKEYFNLLSKQFGVIFELNDYILKLKESRDELIEAYDATIEGWAHALDLRDEETESHSRRVTELTMIMAKRMGISENSLVHVRRGALLHDIGKMGIPDRILHKPGKLDHNEWEIMKMHPVYAYKMISKISFLKEAIDIPYSHHERWDGSGYPLGLSGEKIPLSARIFAVIDAYDALTSDRPYRKAWSKESVRNYLIEEKSKLFDPKVVDEFLMAIEEFSF